MTDVVGSVGMADLDLQIRAVDEKLPPDGTAEFLSWIAASIREHGYVVVYDFDGDMRKHVEKVPLVLEAIRIFYEHKEKR